MSASRRTTPPRCNPPCPSPRPTTPEPTTDPRADTELKGSEFWEVFIQEVPRVPTVDELICRVIGMSYPEGMCRDRQGNRKPLPGTYEAMTKQVLSTLQIAIDSEREFWIRQCRGKGVYTPYAWAVRLNASIALEEAEALILEALQWTGNIEGLYMLYWDAFDRTVQCCQREKREILWAPFNSVGSDLSGSLEDVSRTRSGKRFLRTGESGLN
ncbi:hypothetical protein F5B22DRAFT_438407 [Xylaria bambusicola]|uniref:uncharacterized protein n=1 Tax=Xylaria bambusicola TaxID=326684 RepID=UPI0020082E72|nr:uncharacterized protein F5B22DRAFT_438407 [Xylaria bambusicola]KAI0506639.1 hypothetical protein F5B22DRAFT_438407 [Xylaria bambusicola]